MKFFRRFRARLVNFFSGQSDERLREEMEEHIAHQAAENMRTGMPQQEARRQAVLKFGGTGTIREEYHAEQGLPFFENLFQDLRYALRMLAKSPGFAAVTILTMALGIGATTAIFSLVDATLLHPLRFPHPEELVRIEADLRGVNAQDVGLSIPELQDLQRSGMFQCVTLLGTGSVNLTGSEQPARIQFEPVTPAYFAVLGVKPEMGAVFDPNDKTPGFNLEVVITDGLWKRAFGSDPHILGKSLRLDNDLYSVIGVMPPGFHDPGRTPDERNTDLWAAAGFAGDPAPAPQRNLRLPLGAMARLKPGLTVAGAQSQLNVLVASLQRQFPADYPAESRWAIQLTPLKESVVGNVRQSLVVLLAAVAMVLLIGCVNVANLLLARASARAARDGGPPGTGRCAPGWCASCSRRAFCWRCWEGSPGSEFCSAPGYAAADDSGEPAAAERYYGELEHAGVRAGGLDRGGNNVWACPRVPVRAAEPGAYTAPGRARLTRFKRTAGNAARAGGDGVCAVADADDCRRFAVAQLLGFVSRPARIQSRACDGGSFLAAGAERPEDGHLWNCRAGGGAGARADAAGAALPGVHEVAMGRDASIPLNHQRDMAPLILEGQRPRPKTLRSWSDRT